MKLSTFLLKILSYLLPRHLHHAHIFHRCGYLHGLIKLAVHGIFNQLSHDPTQGLPRARFGDHVLALDYASEGGDGANLVTHERLDFFEEVC